MCINTDIKSRRNSTGRSSSTKSLKINKKLMKKEQQEQQQQEQQQQQESTSSSRKERKTMIPPSRKGIESHPSNDSFSNHSRRRMRKMSSFSQVGNAPTSLEGPQNRRASFVDRMNKSWGDVQRSQPCRRSSFSSGLGEKTVSFDEVVMVRPSLPRSRYSIEEINECWYKKQDKKRFTAEMKDTVKRAKDRKKLDKDESLRGLEKYSPMAKAYEERRKQTVRAVLLEQQYQRKSTTGSHNAIFSMDDSKLRKAYRKGTKPAQTLAAAMGKVDALEAARYQKTWGASVFNKSGLGKVVEQHQKRRRPSGLRNAVRM